MKKFFLLIIIMLSLSIIPTYATPHQKINVEVNGNRLNFDVSPTIESNRTLVPIRSVFEALEIELKWDDAKKQILATKDDTVIELIIDRSYAIVDNKEIPLDAPAKIISGRTLVPVRFIAESTGSTVDWEESTNTVIICSKNKTATELDNNTSATQNPQNSNNANNIANPNKYRSVVLYKGWIYFTYPEELYRMREDGSDQEKIAENIGNYFIIVDDWIYFKDGTGGAGLHKMKLDGSERTLVMEGWTIDINVVDDWIYWTDQESKIVKVKVDGSESSIVLDDTPINQISVIGDWIYYVTSDNLNHDINYKIYKIKTDGTNNVALSDKLSFSMNVLDDWIYYVNKLDGNSIYKMNTDGKQVEKIIEIDTNISYMSVTNDWIYYTTGNYTKDENSNLIPARKLYKLKTDGTQHQLVDSGKRSIAFNVIKDWVYHSSLELYRVKTDGSNKEMYFTPK